MNIKLFRRIHSIAGLTLLVWVLMYFVTGFVMMNKTWLPNAAPEKVTRTGALAWSGERGTPAFIDHLEQTYGLQGRIKKKERLPDGTWRIVWSYPRLEQEVVVPVDGSPVVIAETRYSLVSTMDRLHHVDGYGDGTKYDVWAFFVDVTAVGMLVFTVTGICLWWKVTRPRLAGWVCLLGSFGFTGMIIAYLMLTF